MALSECLHPLLDLRSFLLLISYAEAVVDLILNVTPWPLGYILDALAKFSTLLASGRWAYYIYQSLRRGLVCPQGLG